MSVAPGFPAPSGEFGGYPVNIKNKIFNPYGYAIVNADGTFVASSGNLTMLKGSAGNYILQPKDAFAAGATLAIAMPIGGAPVFATPTFGLGPTSNGWQVITYLAATSPSVPTNEPFLFFMFVTGGF